MFIISCIYILFYLFTSKQVDANKGKEKGKYDGLIAQIKGTTMIRKLCRVVMNLEQVTCVYMYIFI